MPDWERKYMGRWTMPKREKVRRGLELCSQTSLLFPCRECPYRPEEPDDCRALLAKDALALLKKQEPRMVVKTTSTIRCPGCGKQITNKGAIHREIKYCWKCGQAITWEPPKGEDDG